MPMGEKAVYVKLFRFFRNGPAGAKRKLEMSRHNALENAEALFDIAGDPCFRQGKTECSCLIPPKPFDQV